MIEQLAVRIIGKGKKLGTGVFGYPVNSTWCYVYTCRHVLGSACELELELELQECEYKVESDALETACMDEQQDLAVLRFRKPEGWQDMLEEGVFALGNAVPGDRLQGFGYPECVNHAELAFDRDMLEVQVKAVSKDRTSLQLRLDAVNLNQANRGSELAGFSGTGLFKIDKKTGKKLLCGLFREGQNDAARNIAYAVSSQSLLNVLRQNQLEQPESIDLTFADEPAGTVQLIELPERGGTGMDRETCEDYIELKIKEAEKLTGNEAFERWNEIFRSNAFRNISEKKQYEAWDEYLMLLYREDRQEEFRKAVEDFEEQYKEDTPAFFFSRKADMLWRLERYEEADCYAQKALAQEPDNDRYVVQTVLTEAFAEKQCSWEEIKSRLTYPDGTVNLSTQKPEILEYADQTLEVIAIRIFRNAKEGLFFANRAYERRKSEDIKEDLANCYYLAAVEEMTDSDGRLDIHKKNAEYLNRSRSYYREIFDKADGQERKALMRRQGGNYFRCLNLLNDVGAMRHIYREVRAAWPDDAEIAKMMNHAVTQWGNYDEAEVQELPEATKKLLQAQTAMNNADHKYRDGFREEAYLLFHQAGALFEELEGQTEEESISRKDIYIQLMNVYYFLSVYFQEDYQEKFEQYYQKFMACDVTETEKQNMQLFRQELQGDIEGAAKGFAEFADREDTLAAYNQLLHFYTRQGDRESVRRLYEYMIARKGYLIEEDEEYFYRNYITFFLYQCLDPVRAMDSFLKYGNKIQDKAAREYLEMQLRNYSGDFGDMERFLALNEKFYQEQWYPEVHYQGMKALYHLHNGQYEQAFDDYQNFWNRKDGIVPLAQNMILRLNGKIPPLGGNSVFNQDTVRDVLQNKQYIPRNPEGREEKVRKSLQSGKIIVDAWALYILAYQGKLEDLKSFSEVYVTYNTHSWLMQELLVAENGEIRRILHALHHWDNIRLRCPGMAAQVHFRQNLRGGWIEEHANVCMANELHIPLVIGRYLPDVDMGGCWRYLVGVGEMEESVEGGNFC